MWEGQEDFLNNYPRIPHRFTLILILNSFPDFFKALVPNLLRT